MENKHSYARCSTWCKGIQTTTLYFSIAATQSRQEQGGLLFSSCMIYARGILLFGSEYPEKRPNRYHPLPCFVSLSPLTTMFWQHIYHQIKIQQNVASDERSSQEIWRHSFQNNMEYIYIHNITFQVKRGTTKTQYFDFTLKSGSKENSINKNVWYCYM